MLGTRIIWTDLKIVRLKALLTAGLTASQIASRLTEEFKENINYKRVVNAKERYGFLNFVIPIDKEIKIYQELTLPEDNYLVTCDHHSPYHSELYFNRSLMIADKFKLRKQIIVGDLFDMDFAKKFYDDERSTLDKEARHTNPVLKACDYFDENILIRGNHEKRIGISTDSIIQSKHLFHVFGKDVWERKFKFTPYDKIKIGKKWLLVHPKSYSQISASTAVRLAEKYHRHVLNAHGHFVALRYDRSGKYMGIDLGGIFNIRKIKYINETTTTHPFWNLGFGMIKDGKFWHFHEGTDWNHFLKDT